MDKSYLNVLQVHLNSITFSIPPPDKSLIPLFTSLCTQEFPYKENTLYMDVEEIKECNQIPKMEK